MCRGELLEQRALLSVGVLSSGTPMQGPLGDDLHGDDLYGESAVSATIWPADSALHEDSVVHFSAGQLDPPAVASELLMNGGFETGDFTGWNVVTIGQGELTPWTVGPAGGGFFFNTEPLEGSFSAYNGFDGQAGLEYELYQEVAIPADTFAATLTTNYRIVYAGSGDATESRTLEISIRDTDDNVLQTLYQQAVTLELGPQTDLGWNAQVFDVSAYAGQTVRIHFLELVPETHTGPAMIEFDNISLEAVIAPPSELLVNGGFEAGDFTGWTAISSGHSELTPWTVGPAGGGFFFNSSPLQGSYSAYNGFDGEAGLQYELYQEVTIPDDTLAATLTTNIRLVWAGGIEAEGRTLEISIRDTNDRVLRTLSSLSLLLGPAPPADAGWNTEVFDLTPYAGQTVRIHFSESIPESYTAPAMVEFDGISLIVRHGASVPEEEDRAPNPHGLFPAEIAPPARAAAALVMADLNADGHVDMVTTDQSGSHVSVFPGLGDGTFAHARQYAVGDDPTGLALGDLDGDGRIDIVVTNGQTFFANGQSDDVSVLLNVGDGNFAPQRKYAVGNAPFSVALADLDADGHVDLVVVNGGTDDISVLLGRGDGTFADQRRYTVGDDASSIVLEDFNGDGRPDLVMANSDNHAVSVLLGLGDGTFDTPVSYAAGVSPTSVVAADLDGDGYLDLAAPSYEDSSISVLLGRGDGTFVDEQRYPVRRRPRSLVPADLNGDGLVDMVATVVGTDAPYQGGVSILLGLGDGSFAESEMYPVAGRTSYAVAVANVNSDGDLDVVFGNTTILFGFGDGKFDDRQWSLAGGGVRAIAAGDLNADGQLDLVTVDSARLSVLLGEGDGTFPDRTRYLVGDEPDTVAVADLNGDGHLDVVAANYAGNDLAVLLGDGSGAFGPPQHYPVGEGPQAVLAVDLNGDGHVDLVTANFLGDDVSVLLGVGDGTFGGQQSLPVGRGPRSVAAADLNGDRRIDLVTANDWSDDVSILLGLGDGTFTQQQSYRVGDRPNSVALTDLNGDGHTDVVTADYGSTEVSVLLGAGDGSFEQRLRFPVDGSPRSLALGDANGDGYTDVIAATWEDGEVAVLLGRGDGEFDDSAYYPVRYGPRSVALGDFNGDGLLDVVAGTYAGDDVSILLGSGDGAFLDGATYPAGENPYQVALADLDGDGNMDIVTANQASNDLSVLLGLGDGTFGEERRYAVGEGPRSVAVADFNEDGHPDLVAGNAAHHDTNISVLLGVGDGTFLDEQRFLVGYGPRAVTAADVNEDGHMDIITGNYGGTDVSVLLGLGDGTFLPQQQYEAGGGIRSVALADLDGDGHLDIVVPNYGDEQVSFLLGLGDGTFAQRQTLSVGQSPFSVALADLDGNGLADIVVANSLGDGVSVLLSRGLGSFADEQRYLTEIGPRWVALADVNGDGHTDIVARSAVSVLLGLGDGSFSATANYSIGDAGIYYTLALADLNGDGHTDVVTASHRRDEVTVLLNQHPDPLYWDGLAPGNWSDASRWVDGDDRLQAASPDQFTDVVVRTDTVTVDTAASAAWNLTVADGTLALTPDASLYLAGLQIHDAAELRVGLDGTGGALLDVSGSVELGGQLTLEVSGPLIEPGTIVWGLRTRTIIRAAGGFRGDFLQEPSVGEYLGYGAFYRGTSREVDAVFAQWFQAAPGDTDGDGVVDNADLQRILAAGSFNQGQGFDWTDGDFDGDGYVDNADLQLILAAGHFGTGPYAAG